MIRVVSDWFANPTLRGVLVRSRWIAALLLAWPLAWLMRPEWLWPAFAVSMFGQAIQAWCFGALVKNDLLTIRGPYVSVRNPMYLGRYFLVLGFVMLTGNVVAMVVFTVLYYAYMDSRVRREERRLGRLFGADFERYCAEVRRFLPSLPALADPRVRFFDASVFATNHGHWNLLLTLVGYAAVWGLHRALGYGG